MRNHLRAGFSLMELAIVLVVMGLVLGAAMPSILRYRQQAALRETRERQELVIQAVASYVLMYGDLPSPADPSQDGASVNSPTLDKAVGIVPYKTLGLTSVQAKDGFGHYMTYGVPVIYSDMVQSTYSHKLCGARPAHPITLKERGAVRYGPGGDPGNFVALVLVSHGPSGQGAFSGKARERLGGETLSPDERTNASPDLVFQDNPYGAEGSAHPFRHTVKWVTLQNLLGIYGKSPCVRLKPDVSPSKQHNPSEGNAPSMANTPNFDPFRTRAHRVE